MDEKIYGLYPGSLKKEIQEKIPTMTEIEIWKLIYYIEDEIFWANHEEQNYQIDIYELEEKQYALEFVMYNTKKFGIIFNTPIKGKHLEKSNSYISWYQHWNKELIQETKTKTKR